MFSSCVETLEIRKVLVFVSNASFNKTDIIFNLDISYYMFIMPLIDTLISYFIFLSRLQTLFLTYSVKIVRSQKLSCELYYFKYL